MMLATLTTAEGRDALGRELASIEESLANPVESGKEWDERRRWLERRAQIIKLNLRAT